MRSSTTGRRCSSQRAASCTGSSRSASTAASDKSYLLLSIASAVSLPYSCVPPHTYQYCTDMLGERFGPLHSPPHSRDPPARLGSLRARARPRVLAISRKRERKECLGYTCVLFVYGYKMVLVWMGAGRLALAARLGRCRPRSRLRPRSAPSRQPERRAVILCPMDVIWRAAHMRIILC